MLRASQTLDCLRHCGTEHPIYDERLREIDFGNWEMKTFAEIAAADPAKVAAWQEYTNFVFPDGEAVTDFVLRVREVLEFLTTSSGNVGVVTHGGVIRTMICMVLGLPVRNYLLFDVQPASLTILEVFSGGSGVLRGLNL
jgi:broad specificity phosphatase PhoE